MEYETIVNNIKALINKKGMKQMAVAERAGFTQKELSDMLNENRKLIRAEYLPAIANALEVDVSEIFFLKQ